MEEHGEHRTLVGRTLGAAALAWAVGAMPAAACRLALVLALDVSGSVDAREYELQIDGVAWALDAADVRAAILADTDAPVQLAIFEWSGSQYQRQIVDWTPLASAGAIDAVVARLGRWARVPSPEATGIGAAMRVTAGQIGDGPACWRSVLDISGDGKNNDWPSPRQVREAGTMGDITVNALVIGSAPLRGGTREDGIAELVAYFRAEVLHGPGAFVETALGYEDYAEAMRRKLLRELQTMVLGAAPPR